MNDKDFDKLLGDRLREERRFGEADDDWKTLAERLENAPKNGNLAAISTESSPFRRWVLPLMALLLLTTSGLLWAKLTHLDKTHTALAEQIHALKPQLTTIHDTVFIKKTDTIYIERNTSQSGFKNANSNVKNTKFNKSNINSTLNSSSTLNSNSTLNSSYNLENNSNLNSNSNLNNQLNTQLQSLNIELNTAKNKITELENKLQLVDNQRIVSEAKLEKIENKAAESLLNRDLKTELNKNESIDLKTELNKNESTNKKTLDNDKVIELIKIDFIQLYALAKKIADSLITNSKIDPPVKAGQAISNLTKNTIKTNNRPTTPRLFAGVSGGLIYYKSVWKTPLGTAVSRNEQSYQVGLKLEYALTDRLRLTATGDYCPFSFDIAWQDSRYNLPAPTHFYPQNERVKSSKATQKLAQLAIGSKYLFADGKNRWRPYVGAAYSAMRIMPFEVEHAIQNIITPTSVRTLTETSAGTTIANLLLLNGGLEYRFNRRFVVQGETFYSLELNRPQKTYDLFGLRGAFLLNF